MESQNTLIETRRLKIREYVDTDLSAIHSYASLPDAVQFMVWGPNSIEDTENFLREAIQKSEVNPRMSYDLCIEIKALNRLIGGCGLYVKDPDFQVADLGYIIHPDFWGQGIVTEATKAIVNFGQETLKLKKIQATCDLENIGSRRVLEKSGFILIETYKDHFEQKGKLRSSLFFEHPSSGNN